MTDEVEEDWSGFRDTERFKTCRSTVEEHIRHRLAELMKDVHKTRKRMVLEENIEFLADLPIESRYYIGKAIDGIQERMPSIKENVLSATVRVLSNLEMTRSGFALLEQLASLKPDDLDTLNEILAQWSVQDARIVLGELDCRLKLIERLEQLAEDPTSDELHEIQPLFERGLWIFGPEYESIHFASNNTLLNVIRNLLENKTIKPLKNPRRRPDSVVLPDSTIGLYASDAFDPKSSEVNGFDKVLIVELKKGGSRLTIEERRQGEDYAKELRKSGKVQKATRIIVFVLGMEVDDEVSDDVNEGNTTVSARSYSIVLRQAHARTFFLREKIKEAKREELGDPEVEEVVMSPKQLQLVQKA